MKKLKCVVESELNDIIANRTYLIRDMAEDDRPREKAIKHGIKSLSDAELMAIIFGTGMRGKSVLQMSEEILRDNNHHLSLVARMSAKELTLRYKGMGNAKAISLLAALELGARSSADAASICRPKVTSSKTAYDLMKHHFAHLSNEEFWLMLLNQSGNVIREIKISQGGVSATVADVRILLKYMIENLASSAIVFHNHPSGNITPSNEDDRLTKQIVAGAKAVGVRLNDHIIVSDSGYYSYSDNNRLPDVNILI